MWDWSRSSGTKCTLKNCRGTIQILSIPQLPVTPGDNRNVCCKTAREKGSGSWILFVLRVSETDWWNLQDEKCSTVAFTCNHRKERFALLRSSPSFCKQTRSLEGYRHFLWNQALCFSIRSCQIPFLFSRPIQHCSTHIYFPVMHLSV